MARVPYVGVDVPTDPLLAALYESIGELRGSVLNLHRALANQPAALKAFMTMSRYIRDDSSLPPPLREIAILATAYALEVPYEQHHHVRAARRAGVPEPKVSAVRSWRTSALFDDRERAVLAYAEAVARERRVGDGTFAALRQHLNVPEIVDLTLTLGWYQLCAAFLLPLEIEPEADR